MYVSISAIEESDGDLTNSARSEIRALPPDGLPADDPTPSNELRDHFVPEVGGVGQSMGPWTEVGMSAEEAEGGGVPLYDGKEEDGSEAFWSRAPRELKVELPSSIYERAGRSARQPVSPRPSQHMEMIAPSIMTPGDALDGAFEYRPDIDGLRSIAVAAVVAFHCDSRWLPGGFTGVDVFFVISGYVVAGSVLRSSSSSAMDFFAGFYARRAKRLLPSFTAMLFVTALALGACFPPWLPEVDGYYLSGAFAGVGMSNIHFSMLHGGYFDTGGGLASLKRNPFTHTWSLAVEEQFYFVYPFLAFLLYGSQSSLACGRPLSVLGFFAACSMLASGALTEHRATLAFFLLPSRFWELACGVMLFDLRAFSSGYVEFVTRRRNGMILEVCAVLLLACAFVVTEERRGFPMPGALLPVGGAACFIAAGSSPDALLNRCLGSCLPVYIGKLSYPIYLWHWPLLVCGRWMLGDDVIRSGRGLTVLLAALLSLAAFSFHVLEAPFRELRPRRFCLVFVISLSVVGLSELWVSSLRGQLGSQIYNAINSDASGLTPKGDHNSLRRGPAAELVNVSSHVSTKGSADASAGGSADASARGSARTSVNGSTKDTAHGGGRGHGHESTQDTAHGRDHGHGSDVGSANRSAAVNTSIPKKRHFPASDPNMCRCYSTRPYTLHTPSGAQNGTNGVGGPCFEAALPPVNIPPHFMNPNEQPCFISFHSESPSRADMESCLQPDRGSDGKRAIFLIGDSHAQHWKPGLEAAVQGIFTLVHLTAGFPCEYDPPDMRGYGEQCTEFDEVISRGLSSELRQGDLVVYGMMAKIVSHRAQRNEYIAFLLRLHDRAAARGATLLLIADNPELPSVGRYCIPSTLRPDAPTQCELTVDTARQYLSAQLEVYQNISAQRPDTLVFHGADLFCGPETCGAFVPGTDTLAIWDDSHLTEAGSLYAWPFLCSLLQTSGVM